VARFFSINSLLVSNWKSNCSVISPQAFERLSPEHRPATLLKAGDAISRAVGRRRGGQILMAAPDAAGAAAGLDIGGIVKDLVARW